MPTIDNYPDDIRADHPARDVSDDRFDFLVDYAIQALPDTVRHEIRHVAFITEDGDENPFLLGLFRGVPLTKKTHNTGGTMPDTITLFRNPLRRSVVNEKQLYENIVVTVKHEVGHFFGLDHDVLGKHGY